MRVRASGHFCFNVELIQVCVRASGHFNSPTATFITNGPLHKIFTYHRHGVISATDRMSLKESTSFLSPTRSSTLQSPLIFQCFSALSLIYHTLICNILLISNEATCLEIDNSLCVISAFRRELDEN